MFKITVNVEGMMCPHCEKHMEEALTEAFKAEGLKKVKASHEGKTVMIDAKTALSEEKVKAVVAEAGYSFGGMTVTEKKGIFG